MSASGRVAEDLSGLANRLRALEESLGETRTLIVELEQSKSARLEEVEERMVELSTRVGELRVLVRKLVDARH